MSSMISHLLYFSIIFIVGEILVNLTIFKYLRIKYQNNELENNKETTDTFLRINISVFKGMLERFVLFLALVLNISQILIVFGTIKIGTQIDKSKKIRNDYFIIGNIFTIIVAIAYQYIYLRWRYEINIISTICNCS
jgi:hypothetical protein